MIKFKNLFVFALAIAIAFCFAACGKTPSENKSESIDSVTSNDKSTSTDSGISSEEPTAYSIVRKLVSDLKEVVGKSDVNSTYQEDLYSHFYDLLTDCGGLSDANQIVNKVGDYKATTGVKLEYYNQLSAMELQNLQSRMYVSVEEALLSDGARSELRELVDALADSVNSIKNDEGLSATEKNNKYLQELNSISAEIETLVKETQANEQSEKLSVLQELQDLLKDSTLEIEKTPPADGKTIETINELFDSAIEKLEEL